MSTSALFQDICRRSEKNAWSIRLITEIEYLNRLYVSLGVDVPEILTAAIADVHARVLLQGAITRDDVLAVEEQLAPLQADAKRLTMYCVSHAHIDMNWEWGLPETINIVIDTFQTMLNLMEEYPDFIYSQSQGAVYEIIEKYCPSMLPAIRRRVQEGRWELNATTWVESDKNMPGTEAMVRHILYTKRYLHDLFGVDPNSLEVDFEPDTFGHAANLPEILQNGGVKYYYFCRGRKEGPTKVFRWRAASGAEILGYEEPYWYSTSVQPNVVLNLPRYAAENHTNSCMMVYGVGDHGGGPTRRDLNCILDMATWPLMPVIRFSTMREFFHALEVDREKFPIIQEEMNPLYTGCYTSQAKVKRANRTLEDRLYDAEALGVFAALVGDKDIAFENYEKAWRRTLFNQFHDILPGSNSPDSRDHALGNFQEALSYCAGNANRALRSFAQQVTTDCFGKSENTGGTADGAGVGAGMMQPDRPLQDAALGTFGFGSTSHGDGTVRTFVLTNTTQYRRSDSVELTVWDWPYSVRQTEIIDAQGASVSFTVREENKEYWWHTYTKLLVHVTVPALGYTVIAVRYNPDIPLLPITSPGNGVRCDDPLNWHFSFNRRPTTSMRFNRIMDAPIVLENELVRAEFRSEDMALVSFLDKHTGKELIDAKMPSACFRLISESDYFKRPAWRLGPYGHVENLNASRIIRVQEKDTDIADPFVHYEMEFGKSVLKVTVSLAPNSPTLRFSLRVLWREFAEEGVNTPLLQFYVPFSFETDTYRYDVPCGTLDRSAGGYDVPVSLYAVAVPKEGKTSLGLTSDSKYGFRGNYNSLSVSLLRGSYDPDPCQDVGFHTIELGLSAVTDVDSGEMLREAVCFAHPIMAYSTPIQKGTLPVEGQVFSVDENARLIAIKRSEERPGSYVLRLLTRGGETQETVIHTLFPIESACSVDLLERTTGKLAHGENEVYVSLPANGLCSVLIREKTH